MVPRVGMEIEGETRISKRCSIGVGGHRWALLGNPQIMLEGRVNLNWHRESLFAPVSSAGGVRLVSPGIDERPSTRFLS